MTVGATGGQTVVRALRRLGADILFSVSGNQILPIYDAATDAGLRIIHMRHESAAAYAAAAYAERTGRPGIALTSAGPGFLAGLTGVAVARSMELPLLYLSGAAPIAQRGSGAFQDLDQKRIAQAICKQTFEPPAAERIATTITRAWRMAQHGIPGPVHVSLPADLLLATLSTRSRRPQRDHAAAVAISPADRATLDTMARRLATASRPLVIARPSATRGNAGAALLRLCAHLGVEPLITESPRGLSDQKFSDIIRNAPHCDVALVIAPADFATAFLQPAAVAASGEVLLIDAPNDPRPARPPAAWTRVPPAEALQYLAGALNGKGGIVAADWRALWPLAPPPDAPRTVDAAAGVHPLAVAEALREYIQPEDVLVLDGGEFCQWLRLGLRGLPNPLYWNGKLGAIGGGIPMAIGAALAEPGGRVFVAMGDGSAGYHLSEYETAARYGVPIIGIVGNDARWAAEWHMQVARYGPDRTFETELLPARYDIAAQGLLADGACVETHRELLAALSQAVAADEPICINVRVQALRSPAEVKH